MRRRLCLLAGLVILTAACAPGPILNPNGIEVGGIEAGGTIVGMVTAGDPAIGLPGRKVTAVEVNTGTHVDTRTGANGRYTVKVPRGTYRVVLELAPGEALITSPKPTKVNNGDLTEGRNFHVSLSPQNDFLRRVS